jgi:hypothetical protein
MGATGPGGIAGASTLGNSSGGSTGFGSSSTGIGSSSSGFGTSTIGTGSDLTNPTGTTGSTGVTGIGSSPSTGGTSSGTSAFGGQTFGGAGIVGFAPTSPKQSLLVYRKKNHYNEWEFVYDPMADLKTVSSGSGLTGSQPATNITGGIGGTTGTQTATPAPQTPTPSPQQ